MGKQINHQQLEQLKKLRTSLTPFLSIDNKIGAVVHLKQLLKDIDMTSSFTSSLSTELIGLEVYREKYPNLSTITAIVDNAINYYSSQLQS
ncbi:hypothetical protein [Chryseobacterium indoltheticum]|uniref:Uncharacterized protein n=1 Tax=Chryseobacterium indoltheticum TaxID=254 RepID=A0A381FJA8_9FLAO|nr:hypothetical protein [Chryseobacterium indoltheticum]SUX46626.1 Uncharacterised protein [Chryseobacterium indoltheticum]